MESSRHNMTYTYTHARETSNNLILSVCFLFSF